MKIRLIIILALDATGRHFSFRRKHTIHRLIRDCADSGYYAGRDARKRKDAQIPRKLISPFVLNRNSYGVFVLRGLRK